VYPEYMGDAAAWLDGSGGRGSMLAGALRLGDTSGLARASAWCPGSTADERNAAASTAPGINSNANGSAGQPAAKGAEGAAALLAAAAASSPAPAAADGEVHGIGGRAATPQPRLAARRAWQVVQLHTRAALRSWHMLPVDSGHVTTSSTMLAMPVEPASTSLQYCRLRSARTA
jgi:hypothetical protein